MPPLAHCLNVYKFATKLQNTQCLLPLPCAKALERMAVVHIAFQFPRVQWTICSPGCSFDQDSTPGVSTTLDVSVQRPPKSSTNAFRTWRSGTAGIHNENSKNTEFIARTVTRSVLGHTVPRSRHAKHGIENKDMTFSRRG